MTDNIKPDHYRKGEIDLYEAFSQIFPHNEYRAGMQMIAMRYMFRDKIDRVEDLNKSIYTLERLKEKEIEHAGGQVRSNDEQSNKSSETIHDLDDQGYIEVVKTKIVGRYLDEIYFKHERLLKRLRKKGYLFLARDENGDLFGYTEFPEKSEGNGIWDGVSGDYDYYYIRQDDFPEVKWTDEEPTKIADLLDIYQNGGENGK